MSRRHISKKIMKNVLWGGMFFFIMAPAAETNASFRRVLNTEEPALSNQQLDQLRGGFLTDSGFLVKFSFQNLVKIDGVLQATTVIEMPELQVPTLTFADDASPSVSPTVADQNQESASLSEVPVSTQDVSSLTVDTDADISSVASGHLLSDSTDSAPVETVVSSDHLSTVIQSGPNNYISPESLQNLEAVQTFIQNTLNDKLIQHTQILNIEITKYPFQLHEGMISRINAQLFDLH
ncbi:MAG: hypothetical protein P8Y63_11920 [Deltaproteobacteria bacterium]